MRRLEDEPNEYNMLLNVGASNAHIKNELNKTWESGK